MASWFNVDSIKGLTDKVQKALPKIDTDEMLEKLTLTTPELTAERHRIDREEKQKEHVKNMLAGILPWETRDPERDILVDECKEAILQLSSDKQTFFGPYQMPDKAVKLETASTASGDNDDANVVDGDEEEGNVEQQQPHSESLEKLAKLEPLPILLKDFDLDAHVGLINRLLKEDPQLVEMQSSLSGGGERERIFWNNYFFHCAYTRYEAGLSIDEIWSDQPLPPPPASSAAAAATANDAAGGTPAAGATATNQQTASSTTEEETITFDDGGGSSVPLSGSQNELSEAEGSSAENALAAAAAAGIDMSDAGAAASEPGLLEGNKAESAPNSNSSDYEIVAAAEAASASDNLNSENDGDDGGGGGNNNDEDEDDIGDYELDELEAEIARELED